MPSPEKFKESLIKFGVASDIITRINDGYEQVVSSSPKKVKAAYFKRAMDLLDENLETNKRQEILAWTACCKGGSREKASKAFAKENGSLTLEEKLEKIHAVPHMGRPMLNADGTITLRAVEYIDGDRFACACPNYNRLKRDYPVSRTYCLCCGGHFQYHYEIMLGVHLRLLRIDSSPLDSDGQSPCIMTFEIA